jgi:hypothetical protein
MPFQTAVPVNIGLGVAGDFASTNPRQHLVGAHGTDQRMVADAAGVTVGKFAILNSNGTVTEKPTFADVNAARLGFVHRAIGSALITTWLAETSNVIPQGRPVELFSKGDFFVNVDAVTGTPTRGAKVIWNPVTGAINIGAAVGAATVDTGFVLLTETAVAGQLVIIGRQNPIVVGTP